MTKLELLPYQCIRCNKTFLSYKEIEDDIDKQLIKDLIEESLIDYLHPIKNERECRACRRGIQLDLFFDPDFRE